MDIVVTKRGQAVIPAALRKKYKIQAGDSIVWIDDGELIKVISVPADPINALRGRGQGENLTERLLESRREDRELSV